MIFAHLGGVDEIGIFLVPAVIAILGLRSGPTRKPRNVLRNTTGSKPTRRQEVKALQRDNPRS